MPLLQRIVYGALSMIALAAFGIIYTRVYPWLRHYAVGEYSGPFTSAILYFDFVIPAIIGGLALATVAWVIYGSIQEEKSRQVQRKRPPK